MKSFKEEFIEKYGFWKHINDVSGKIIHQNLNNSSYDELNKYLEEIGFNADEDMIKGLINHFTNKLYKELDESGLSFPTYLRKRIKEDNISDLIKSFIHENYGWGG